MVVAVVVIHVLHVAGHSIETFENRKMPSQPLLSIAAVQVW